MEEGERRTGGEVDETGSHRNLPRVLEAPRYIDALTVLVLFTAPGVINHTKLMIIINIFLHWY